MFSARSGKFTFTGFMVCGGALCGLLILSLTGLSKSWAMFTIAGLVISCVALISGNVKYFIFLFLCFVIPMNAEKNIDSFLNINMLSGLSISLVNIMTVLLCAIWVFELARNKNHKVHFFAKTTVPALVLICIYLLSVIVHSHNNEMTFYPVVRLALDFLLYFYLANNIKSEKVIKHVVCVFLLAAFIQCGLANLEIWRNIEFDLFFNRASRETMLQNVGGTDFPRISGTLTHPNILAAYLGSIVLLLMSLMFVETGKKRKVIYCLGIGSGVYVVINTFSRGMWFGLFVLCSLTMFKYLMKSANAKKTISVLLISALLITVFVLPLLSRIIDRSVIDDSVSSRPLMIQVAYNMIKDYPLFGVGIGNYMSHMLMYDETATGITSVFPAPVHNVYMLVAAETGIIGLIIFLWFNLAVFSEGWRFVTSEISYLTNVGLGFFSFIVMFLLFFGMTNWIAPTEFIFIFFPLGLITGIKKMLDDAERPPSALFRFNNS